MQRRPMGRKCPPRFRTKAGSGKKRAKAVLSFVIMALLLLVLFFASVNIGSLKVSFGELLQGLFGNAGENAATVFDLRFPRILISMLAGAATAVSGVLFQSVLKNPLADPGNHRHFQRGQLCGGGDHGLCAVPVLLYAAVCLPGRGCWPFSWSTACPGEGGLSPLRIILVGVAVNAMFTGLSSALNSMTGGNSSGVASIVNGNITMKTWDDVWTLWPYVAAGLLLALFFAGKCNLMSLEDRTARSPGASIVKLPADPDFPGGRPALRHFHGGWQGAISFLGLIVPHIGRILVGSDHRALIPFSMLSGAFTYLLADTIGRTIAAPYEISASIIMSVAGGPFFYPIAQEVEKICRLTGSRSRPWKYGICISLTEKIRFLKGVSLKIAEGEITTILGANGCGKSTLFYLMTRNLIPRKGNIFLHGKNILNLGLKDFAKKVSIVHQYNTSSDDITVERLVSFGRTPHMRMMQGRNEEGGMRDDRLISVGHGGDRRGKVPEPGGFPGCPGGSEAEGVDCHGSGPEHEDPVSG